MFRERFLKKVEKSYNMNKQRNKFHSFLWHIDQLAKKRVYLKKISPNVYGKFPLDYFNNSGCGMYAYACVETITMLTQDSWHICVQIPSILICYFFRMRFNIPD